MRVQLLPLLALLALLPARAHAQSDTSPDDSVPHRRRTPPGLREVRDDFGGPRRRGFWLSASLGVGGESFDARDGLGWSDAQAGLFSSLKLGGTLNRNLLLGVEANGWAEGNYNNQGYDRSLFNLMGIAQWYPAARGNFWLKGGFGWAHSELRQYIAPGLRYDTGDDGVAFSAGLGVDVPVNRRFAITPLLDLTGQHYDTHDERVLSFGVALTFH